MTLHASAEEHQGFRLQWDLVPYLPLPIEARTTAAYEALKRSAEIRPALRLVASERCSPLDPGRVLRSYVNRLQPLDPPVRGRCATCSRTHLFRHLTGSLLLHGRCVQKDLHPWLAEELILLGDACTAERSWAAAWKSGHHR